VSQSELSAEFDEHHETLSTVLNNVNQLVMTDVLTEVTLVADAYRLTIDTKSLLFIKG